VRVNLLIGERIGHWVRAYLLAFLSISLSVCLSALLSLGLCMLCMYSCLGVVVNKIWCLKLKSKTDCVDRSVVNFVSALPELCS